MSVSYSGGQATIVLKTDKATAAAISRHIDKAAAQEGVSKAEALENLIFNRTSSGACGLIRSNAKNLTKA